MFARIVMFLAVTVLGAAAAAHADPAAFDLAGPSIEVKVMRGAVTLPIAQVPNLAVGDTLFIKAELPPTQSANYLMVAAFLRGSTNPPPKSWFFPCETWTHRCAENGLTIEVPAGAQQVLLFLAPKTAGDFKTLVSAVRGRPGAFVRASQDLNQATLDRSRLESYLLALRLLEQQGPTRLKESAPLLARSLAIKLDDKCLDKLPELEVPCLMEGRDSLILNDGHSTSIVEALTSGPAADLAMEASYTPQLSYGYYSPYLASVLDIARIMNSFDTAQYQYIPALGSQHADQLELTLNTPPSFHDPESVLVAALPAVEPPQLPPLHAVDPNQMFCAKKNSLVLPVEGAPLVFASAYARELTLRLSGKDGNTIDLAAKADPQQGGLVLDTSALSQSDLGESIRGWLHGYWGFDTYEGPSFQLTTAQALAVAPSEATPLIVGREDTLHLQAVSVSCIADVLLRDSSGKQLQAPWKSAKGNDLEVQLPLQEVKPGTLTLLITQYGVTEPQPVALQTFSEAGHLESFTIRAGDAQALLKGSRLDQVASASLRSIRFMPSQLSSDQGTDQLLLVAQNAPAAAALRQGDSGEAIVTLRDGRSFSLAASVLAPRPSATLIGKSVQPSLSSTDSNIELIDQGELPQDAKLTFSLRAVSPSTFARDEKFEVATADHSFSTSLSLSNGGVTLEDAQVAVARLDPASAFGPSAFGPLQFRVIADGVSGDWQPLVTLVRLPLLKQLSCPPTPDLACKLSGSNLFLVGALSNRADFGHPVEIPDGFPGYSLPVPHPTDGQLYVKLRDDPSVASRVVLEVQPLPLSADELARAAARHAAAAPDTGTTHADSTHAEATHTEAPSTAGASGSSPALPASSGSANTVTPTGQTSVVPPSPHP